MNIDIPGTIIGVASYPGIVDQKTGTVSSGLSLFVVFDGDPPDPWLGSVPQKFWLADHPQVPYFSSPEGRKFGFPKRAVFNCTIGAKKEIKLLGFKPQA